MKKYLFLYAVLATALLVYTYRRYHTENRRLQQNQTALASAVEHYKTRAGEEGASTHVLRLRCSEFERLRAEDAARIRELGLRLRRVEAAATTATATAAQFRSPLRDTVVIRVRDTVIVRDTLRSFHWQDTWVRVEGLLSRDSVSCRIASVDTLRQIVHRVPRRFLFIRWGTKALRQEIISSNPHTQIVFSEYLKVEK